MANGGEKRTGWHNNPLSIFSQFCLWTCLLSWMYISIYLVAISIQLKSFFLSWPGLWRPWCWRDLSSIQLVGEPTDWSLPSYGRALHRYGREWVGYGVVRYGVVRYGVVSGMVWYGSKERTGEMAEHHNLSNSLIPFSFTSLILFSFSLFEAPASLCTPHMTQSLNCTG